MSFAQPAVCGFRDVMNGTRIAIILAVVMLSGCASSSLCTGDGKRMGTSDDDCRKSPACRSDGLCSGRGGKCVASSDDDCKSSSGCKDAGKCSARADVCTAAPAADPDDPMTWAKRLDDFRTGKMNN